MEMRTAAGWWNEREPVGTKLKSAPSHSGEEADRIAYDLFDQMLHFLRMSLGTAFLLTMKSMVLAMMKFLVMYQMPS
jgi:hypothetical protein